MGGKTEKSAKVRRWWDEPRGLLNLLSFTFCAFTGLSVYSSGLMTKDVLASLAGFSLFATAILVFPNFRRCVAEPRRARLWYFFAYLPFLGVFLISPRDFLVHLTLYNPPSFLTAVSLTIGFGVLTYQFVDALVYLFLLITVKKPLWKESAPPKNDVFSLLLAVAMAGVVILMLRSTFSSELKKFSPENGNPSLYLALCDVGYLTETGAYNAATVVKLLDVPSVFLVKDGHYSPLFPQFHRFLVENGKRFTYLTVGDCGEFLEEFPPSPGEPLFSMDGKTGIKVDVVRNTAEWSKENPGTAVLTFFGTPISNFRFHDFDALYVKKVAKSTAKYLIIDAGPSVLRGGSLLRWNRKKLPDRLSIVGEAVREVSRENTG